MDRGEVWWADLPPPIGRRPVLIVTRASAVAVRNQLVVAQVTRTRHHIASEVAIDTTDGMPQSCVVNCDMLLTVPKSRLLRRITQLSTARMTEIEVALKFSLGLS